MVARACVLLPLHGGCSGRKKVALEDNVSGDKQQEQGIAAMRRFKSGRRTAAWVEEAFAAVAAAGEQQQQQEKQENAELHATEQWAQPP
ncbi:hypothetical protein GUJ93_ZPchr0483g7165, partial [Zizania palustris]